MSDAREQLLELNRNTFRAEEQQPIGEQTWKEFLTSALADEFVIRRAKIERPNQNKAQMIRWIEDHPPGATPRPRTLDEEGIRVFCSDTQGVVITLLTMPAPAERYQNIKVFQKGTDGNWQCVYWQVTQMPEPPKPADPE
jgi:hypothetical protein